MAAAKDIAGLAGTGIGTALGGPVGAAIGGGLGSLVGGLFGGDAPSPYDIWKDQKDRLDKIDLPTLQALIAAGKIDSSALADLNVDPTGRAAQVDALGGLTQEYQRNGATVQDRSAQAQLMDRASQQARSDREAIMQEMAGRGQAGGGSELAARLTGQQGAYRANALGGAQLAGDDRQRALEAMTKAGSLGTTVRGDDTALAATRAQAHDALDRWNATNRRDAIDTNTRNQFTRATGQAGAAAGMAAGSNEQYTRNVNAGGAAGTLAGGVYDYVKNKTKPGPGQPGYDAGAGFDSTENYG